MLSKYFAFCKKHFPKLTDDVYVADDSGEIKHLKGKFFEDTNEPTIVLSDDDDCPTLSWCEFDSKKTLKNRCYRTRVEAQLYLAE